MQYMNIIFVCNEELNGHAMLFTLLTCIYLMDFFCSGVQFNLLLSPCPCFVSLLYLDLYVLGDGALVGWGSFVRAKCLCVLIHI